MILAVGGGRTDRRWAETPMGRLFFLFFTLGRVYHLVQSVVIEP